MNKKFLISAFTLAVLTPEASAQAIPPDSGQIQRDTAKSNLAGPVTSKIKALPKLAEAHIPDIPLGGTEVLIKSIKFTGNTVYTNDELLTLVADYLNKKHNLEGIRAMGNVVNNYYHENGYYFCRTIIPIQEFNDGVLTISIQEGTYGKTTLAGDEFIVKGMGTFIDTLFAGKVIELGKLENALLTMDDIPGISIFPVITEGTTIGTADLTVTGRIDYRTGGEIGIDNNGSRYTGPYRATARWFRNTNLVFGDNIELNATASDASLWLGSIKYDAPLNGSGLRGQLNYSYTSYELGKDFAPLGATGFAKVWSATLGYNLIRSQKINLHISGGYQHKALNDHYSVAGVNQNKTSDSFPILLHFDRRDKFMSGGITYGLLTWTPDTLNLDAGQLINDQVTARTDGFFSKVNLDLVRIQSLPENMSLYLRYSLQTANKNLDSSEKMSLGRGGEGVRAYPIGEGTGDEGWLAQAELRYNFDEYAPYIFYDAGSTKANHQAWDANSDKSRTIAGAGIGLRYNFSDQKFSANINIAWRTDGGAPQNDVGNGAYRINFSASHLF